MTTPNKRTVDEECWREHEIHANDDDDNDKELVFHMFETPDDESYEMIEYSYNKGDRHYGGESISIRLRGHSQYPNSTGLAMWRGSEILGDYISQNGHLVCGKKVVELGAGLGLCGLVANALHAQRVVMTDGDSAVLDNLRYNVANCCKSPESMRVTQLIWGKHVESFIEEYGRQDVVLAADCVYMRQSLVPFWKTVDQILKSENGVVLYVNVSASQASREEVLDVGSQHGFVAQTTDGPALLFGRKAITS